MDTTIIWQLLLQAVLIFLNAVFAAAEIAVISMNDAKLAKLAQEGDKRALKLARLTNQPAKFLATIQVAITFCNALGSAFAAENFADRIVAALEGTPLPVSMGTVKTLSLIVVTAILSYFMLVFGELVPKRLAMRKAEKLALGLSSLLDFIAKAFVPFVALLTASTNGVLRLFGIDPKAEDDEVSEEEIRMMVDVGSEKGTIDDDEKELINNVFDFDDLSAGEIGTHRTNISFLYTDESVSQWEKEMRSSAHHYYPLCDEDDDDVIGIIDADKYFRLKNKERANVMENAFFPALFAPSTLRADLLFEKMKEKKTRVAIITDEYGGTFSIVTMSDIIEQIMGDFDDDNFIEKIAENKWRINGRASLKDVAKELDIRINDMEYDIFNGFVIGEYGSIPSKQETINLEDTGICVIIEQMQDNMIESALVSKKG